MIILKTYNLQSRNRKQLLQEKEKIYQRFSLPAWEVLKIQKGVDFFCGDDISSISPINSSKLLPSYFIVPFQKLLLLLNNLSCIFILLPAYWLAVAFSLICTICFFSNPSEMFKKLAPFGSFEKIGEERSASNSEG